MALHDAPGRRRKLVDLLDHAFVGVLDDRFCSLVPRDQHSAAQITSTLRDLGAPDTCHVIGGGRLDGSDGPLDDVLARVVGHGVGALVCCVGGRLAFYESEEAGRRYILRRSDA